MYCQCSNTFKPIARTSQNLRRKKQVSLIAGRFLKVTMPMLFDFGNHCSGLGLGCLFIRGLGVALGFAFDFACLCGCWLVAR